jgi:hypothetical protein
MWRNNLLISRLAHKRDSCHQDQIAGVTHLVTNWDDSQSLINIGMINPMFDEVRYELPTSMYVYSLLEVSPKKHWFLVFRMISQTFQHTLDLEQTYSWLIQAQKISLVQVNKSRIYDTSHCVYQVDQSGPLLTHWSSAALLLRIWHNSRQNVMAEGASYTVLGHGELTGRGLQPACVSADGKILVRCQMFTYSHQWQNHKKHICAYNNTIMKLLDMPNMT